jgi:hypothetical protein
LLEPVDQALDPVPFPVGRSIKAPVSVLIALVRNDSSDAFAAQLPTNAPAAGAFVADHPFGALSRASAPAPFDATCLQQRLKHRLLVSLARSQPEHHWFPLALCTEMELGTEPALTAAQRFITPSSARSSRMLMSTNHRSIEKMEGPIQGSQFLGVLLQGDQDLVP